MSDHKVFDITPLDPDIVVITDWLAGELSPAEVTAVEQRLRDDDAFFMKAGPIYKLWNKPIKYEALLAQHAAAPTKQSVPATPPVSEWARAAAAAIVRGVGAEPLPELAAQKAQPLVPPKARITIEAPSRLPMGERVFQFWFGWAGETTPPGPGRYWARIKWSYGTMLLGAFGVDRRKNPPESVIEKSETLSLVWTRVEQGLAFTGLAALVLVFGMGMYSGYQDADDSAFVRRAVHVVTRPALPGAARLVTQSGQEVTMVLPGGVRTTVRASSKLEWTAAGAVMLRGEATFDVPADVREQRVLTDYGDVRMTPGKYALGRSGDGKAVLLSVVAGFARLRADTTDSTTTNEVIVGPGEFGEMSSRGTVGKVATHVATEHPRFARERTVYPPATTASGVKRWRQFSWIRLAPGSRLTWDANNQSLLHLTGEMALVLDPRDGSTRVKTDFGDVVLHPGSHAMKTVNDSGHTPVILVSTRGEASRILPRPPRGPSPTDQIVEALGLESGRVRTRTFGPSDYPALIPDSLAPRTPFGAAKGVRP
jgi:hypothetical protein